MKKTLFIIGFYALAEIASAQFIVSSAGSAPSYITGNTSGNNGLSISTQNNTNGNLYGGAFSSSYASLAVGLRGFAQYGTTGIGVMGLSGSSTNTIGLFGSISNTGTGACIYGTIYGEYGSALSYGEKYAGFFNGSVKVTGSITTSTTLQGVLLGEASSSLGSSGNAMSLRSGSIASSLSGLNVTTYQKERPEMPEITDNIFDDIDIDSLHRGEKPEPDVIDEQFYDKNHYALDADRLEEAFPDLVYVRKDGTKAINYMEMIPLLVQSINATEIQGSLKSQNKLYQNTPNPFKAQTIIRFSLADDVQNAAICIFDMTGKTIKKLPISSGMESVSIGGYELGEGMFLYSLVVNGQEIDTKRMIISK